jgi:hypothetical protein
MCLNISNLFVSISRIYLHTFFVACVVGFPIIMPDVSNGQFNL